MTPFQFDEHSQENCAKIKNPMGLKGEMGQWFTSLLDNQNSLPLFGFIPLLWTQK